MNFLPVFEIFKKTSAFSAIRPVAGKPINLRSLPGDSDAFLAASLFTKGETVLVTVPDARAQERLRREIISLTGENSVAVMPSRDAVPYNMKSPFGPITEERLRAIKKEFQKLPLGGKDLTTDPIEYQEMTKEIREIYKTAQ